ncbi:MAG: 2-oxoacid:acceptor oxidoreductase family protein [Chloroflexi bacterium]|nr:2-oxoacid:acceptor oxidoreductase family protein [Chloroflexota bacterium]
MIEIRFHGRGGQGAVVACDILALALLKEHQYAQASSLFGAERRGAPVQAFLRTDPDRVLIRGEIFKPDHIVILDPTLIKNVPVTAGLKPGGWIVMNSASRPKASDFPPGSKIAFCDAGAIAAKHGLGSPQSPIVNTAILGGLIKVIKLVSLDSLANAIREIVPGRKEENVAAAKGAYESIQIAAS